MIDYKGIKEAVSLQAYANDYLETCGNGHVCPSCKSGTGKNKTPAFSIKGNRWHCFSCNSSGDVFDLAGIVNGTTDRASQAKAVCEWAGIAWDTVSDNQKAPQKATESRITPVNTKAAKTTQTIENKPVKDFTEARRAEAEKVRAWQANIDSPAVVEYLETRGMSIAEARDLEFGYDLDRRRLIIPFTGCEWYHIDRDITGRAHKYDKPKAEDVGPQPLYTTPGALDAGAVFIVEGVMDAIAVARCGQSAAALCGTYDANKSLVSALLAKPVKPLVYIMLDRDEAGRAGARKLLQQLEEVSISAEIVTAPEVIKGKDADEMARTDYINLVSWLESTVKEGMERRAEQEEAEYRNALKSFHVLDPALVVESLYTQVDALDPIPTGFKQLDVVINGGLVRGLYIIGAVSSLGKTSLTIQIADQIAASGYPVLFVTIEQGADELAARSLARLLRESWDGRGPFPASSSEIMRKTARAGWSAAQNAAFDAACTRYVDEIAPNMHVLEGSNRPSVSDIEVVAKRIKAHEGRAPVVFIDYLQLLKPENERDTDKQATDKNVTQLRQLARGLNTPVFVISSLNRSSYSGTISMESFKESGAIEYGSDVLLGLQPRGMVDLEDERKAKTQSKQALKRHKGNAVRSCELVILKQRNGATPDEGIPFEFTAPNSYFKEV